MTMPRAPSAATQGYSDDLPIVNLDVWRVNTCSPSAVSLSDRAPGAAASARVEQVQPAERTEFRVLWIDDEVTPDDPLVRLLALHGFRIDVTALGAQGLAMAQRGVYAAIIIDLRLTDMFGLTLVERIVASRVRAPVLVVTGYYDEPEMETRVLRAGAAAFYRKPLLGVDELAAALRGLISQVSSRSSAAPLSPCAADADIVAASPAMRSVVEWIDHVAPANATVLLTGETGTGKELIARALHRRGGRRHYPFVPVNCGAIPEHLVESELFGHRKGAFTGAVGDKPGLVASAHRGTLFLDELGDLPLSAQVHLLRFVESGEVRRVGDTKTIEIDVRLVAATNRPLEADVALGRLRSDLYFRLAVIRRHIPPLRERPEDIEALVAYWLPRVAARDNPKIVGLSEQALALLRAHRWPGNVRELRNVLEQAVCMACGEGLTASDIKNALSSAPPILSGDRDWVRAGDIDRALSALEANRGNRTRAARQLGINRSTLWRWLRGVGVTTQGRG